MFWLISVPIGMIAVIAAITWSCMWAGAKERRRARENGCTCYMGDLVIMARSDCPYHGPKMKKEGRIQ